MATVPIPTLKDPKYMNWIRAGLGLLIVKKNISPATMRIIEDFHRSIVVVPTSLRGAISALTPPAAAAVAAPVCSCTFKDTDFKKKCMKTHCTICNPLVQLILASQNCSAIYKDNCDPCKWSTDAWEMAKAFMGPGQQEDNHGPEQTDCANLVLLWDNCFHFSSHISDQTLLKKVREARNAGMHSPKLTLSDMEMTSAFESMINLLQDATLSAEPDIDASSGVSELEKIRDQRMSILPEDELNVWLDQIKSLDNNWEQLKRENEPVAAFLQKNPDLLERISQEWPKLQGRVANVEQGLHQVEHRLHREEQGLHQVDQRVDHVEQRLRHEEQGLHHVHQRVDHVEQRLRHEEQGLNQVDQRVDHVEQRLYHEEQKVDVLQEDVAGMRITMEKSTGRKDSMALLQELRTDLAESYLTGECSRTQPISSLCNTLPVRELLVPVSLTRTTRGSFRQAEKNERSIDAEAILSHVGGDSSSPKRILVEGEPGRGKSMLSKSLALSWAQDVRYYPPEPATRQDTASQSLPDSGTGSQPVSCINTPAQRKKEVSVTPINAFLIVVLFTVNTLIGGGVAENLLLLVAANWKSHKEEISESLETNCKQVLLIFDGFDETSSPQPEILTEILDGRLMKGCTIITTSRPGFCGATFDVSYRLEGFNMNKRESYVNKFLSAIHDDPNKPRQKLLLERLQSTGTVANLYETPLFLVLVCLISTQENNALPDRRTKLYEQFDDFIHDEAVKRCKIQSHTIIYLREVLQRAAYAMLMDNSSEVTAASIHHHSSTETTAPGPPTRKHDMTPLEPTRHGDVMTQLCHVGFLAQSQHPDLQGLKTVSTAHFIHQSFVDYFAAKHVASSSEEQQTTLIEQLFKHKDIIHNIFVFIAGLATNSNLLVKLLTRWWGAMAAEQMPSFNPSDMKGEMERMGNLTRDNHALQHAPLGWLAETTAACSVLQVLASHTQLKAISLTRDCTETCLTAVNALCKAGSSEHQPTPRPLYLGLYVCVQFKVCDVLALLQKAALTHGVIKTVLLWSGYGSPFWTEAECRSLAALLAQLKQIRKIVINVRGCSALEALSRGLTADAQLQHLRVFCRPSDDDGGHHSLPEFRNNIKRLRNIERLVLIDFSGSRMSDDAASELRRWGQEQRVRVELEHWR